MKKRTLILLRHGESVWNQKNLFTGWVDIPLSKKGIQESLEAGEKIKEIPIDFIFTSTLIRSDMTMMLALLSHESGKIPVIQHPEEPWSKIHSEETLKQTIPVVRARELNERMYGDLQGLNKKETADQFGADMVQQWRRSYQTEPPGGESLKQTVARALPFFKKEIVGHLDKGENVLVVAHGNSLRAIVMHLDHLSESQVMSLEIPTGVPLIYSYEEGSWKRELR
jgi:2,3-bisphosphoglycerate-dependent phosphoglycerate mutase